MSEDFGWRDFLVWHIPDLIWGGIAAALIVWFLSGHVRVEWR